MSIATDFRYSVTVLDVWYCYVELLTWFQWETQKQPIGTMYRLGSSGFIRRVTLFPSSRYISTLKKEAVGSYVTLDTSNIIRHVKPKARHEPTPPW